MLNVLNEKIEYPRPLSRQSVPCVMAFSEAYSCYAAVMMQSAFASLTSDKTYDFWVLHTDIGIKRQRELQALSRRWPQVSLRFLDVNQWVDAIGFRLNKIRCVTHVSKETYYRLLVPDIFRYYEKIIYLDCDLIVLRDIAQLYDEPMGNAWIAAVLDVDHAGQYNGATKIVRIFCDDILKLKRPFSYIQAGVLVMNIHRINNELGMDTLLHIAQRGMYLYVDQDVINQQCEGHIHTLPMNWNVLTDCRGLRIKKYISRAPNELFMAYMRSRTAPYILHYAGDEKPWTSPQSDMASYFWQFANQSPFLKEIRENATLQQKERGYWIMDMLRRCRQKVFFAQLRIHCRFKTNKNK